jgi:C1A family cysteine protease
MEFLGLVLTVVVLGGAIWFLTRLDSDSDEASEAGETPDLGSPPINGWVPDIADPRDHIYEEVARSEVEGTRSSLPPLVDLRGRFRTAVESQGNTNSCVGHAVTAALEAAFRSTEDRSRLFVYWNSRSFEGTTNSDPGTQIRNAMRGVSQFGAARETVWPWSTNQTTLRTKPSAAAYTDGTPLRSQIASYARITTFQGMKEALAAGRPVVFGFSATRTFVDQTRTTGHLPYPAAGEAFLGGHAVVAVGYDDATGRVLCRNSYGPTWGMNGHFTMDYAWFSNMNGLVADAWAIIPR